MSFKTIATDVAIMIAAVAIAELVVIPLLGRFIPGASTQG